MIAPKLIPYLFYIAVIGWVIGLIIHILSIAQIDVREYFPFVWVIHVLIFVIWLPMILFLQQKLKEQDKLRVDQPPGGNPGFFAKGVFRHTPPWLRAFALTCFFYAGLNFVLSMQRPSGTVQIRDGQYVLQARGGRVIRTMTEGEYHLHRAAELRGFSGHWLLFYGAAIALLFPYRDQTPNMTNSGTA